MTETLFDATLLLARALTILRTSTSDSVGTSTTLIDSNRGGNSDDWEGGTLWHLDVSEYKIIDSYDPKTGTFTLRSALADATTSGDNYAVADAEYPIDLLEDAINSELTMLRYAKVDTSSITIVDEQSEYTLPTDCHDLRQVYWQTNDDANENLWVKLNNWTVEKTATGSANTLIIDHHGIAEDYDLKLVYVTRHGALYDDAGQIDESINIQRIIPSAVLYCIYNKFEDANKSSSKGMERLIQRWEREEEMARLRYPIRLPAKDGMVMALGTNSYRDEAEIGDI